MKEKYRYVCICSCASNTFWWRKKTPFHSFILKKKTAFLSYIMYNSLLSKNWDVWIFDPSKWISYRILINLHRNTFSQYRKLILQWNLELKCQILLVKSSSDRDFDMYGVHGARLVQRHLNCRLSHMNV